MPDAASPVFSVFRTEIIAARPAWLSITANGVSFFARWVRMDLGQMP